VRPKLALERGVRLGIFLCGLVLLLAPATTARAQAAAAKPLKVVVAVLPFEVHSERPLDYLQGSLADLLSTRLEAGGGVEVVDAVTVRQSLVAYGGERSEDAVRRLAAELGADWIVVGSLTELAGNYSLDVRVSPVNSRVSTATMVFTAKGDDELLDRVNELAGRVLVIVGQQGESAEVAEVVIQGMPDLAKRARAAIETRQGVTYDSAMVRRDLQRLRALPGVATASVAPEHNERGVRVVFHLVPAERLLVDVGPSKQERIAQVVVRGNRRIEANAILARVGTHAGDLYVPSRVAQDLRAVYSLGFFRNVRVYLDAGKKGRILTFEVQENPVIRQVTVSGNDSLDGDKIRDNLTLTTGSTLDYPLLFENRERVEALYRAKGYYLAKVRYELETLPGDAVAVHFEVNEGKKLRLTKIVFSGNEHFSQKQLEAGLHTKRWHWYSYATRFLDKSGTYSEPVFLQDLQGVTNKYLDAGYIKATVKEPDVEPTKDGLIVKVAIDEGKRYEVGKVDTSGDDTVDLEALRKKLELKEGDYFNRSFLNADLESLERRYTDRGFFLAEVSPVTHLDEDALRVDVTFDVKKGPLYFLRKIDVSGNTTTIDPVIRREVQVVEGQLYSARAINRSKGKVKGLGFFEQVNFEPQQTDQPDLLDLDVKVVEKPTGSLSFGGGFSSQDGLVVMGSLSQRNLFGRAIGANLSLDLGIRTTRFNLGLSQAHFLDSDFGASASIFRTDLQFQDFQQQQLGVDLALSHALDLSGRSRGFLRYTLAKRSLSEDKTTNAASMIQRQLQQDKSSSSVLGLTYRSDTRNDRVAPTSGRLVQFSLDGAGLGGFSKFARAEGRVAFFTGIPKWFPSWFPWKDKSAFSFSARGGWAIPFNSLSDWNFGSSLGTKDLPKADEVQSLGHIDEDLKLPLSERYFLGGVGSFQLRGFKARSVGPRRALLRRTGALGTGKAFTAVGRTIDMAVSPTKFVCRDGTGGVGNNQGNGNGKCNSIYDKKISDFNDLEETDVIGGNKFVSLSLDYRFPISETLGLMGIAFFDTGNAFAENEKPWQLGLWRMGTGVGALWFSPFGPLQAFIGFPVDRIAQVEKAEVFEFSVGGQGF